MFAKNGGRIKVIMLIINNETIGNPCIMFLIIVQLKNHSFFKSKVTAHCVETNG
jgi:hypothetical protein